MKKRLRAVADVDVKKECIGLIKKPEEPEVDIINEGHFVGKIAKVSPPETKRREEIL